MIVTVTILTSPNDWSELLNSTVVLGQTYDIFTNIQKSWNNFLSTGQAGAFVIGMIIGWFIKSIMP